MACFHPVLAHRPGPGRNISKKLMFRPDDESSEIELKCGRCVGCRQDYAKAWALRCMHEAAVHEHSSFVTLTYSPEHCPRSLRYPDFRRFMRRLRQVRPGVRFYMCGEYGETFGRPHFHALLFGCSFADRLPTGPGSDLYTSAELSKLWPLGFSSIGDVTYASAAYVAGYVVKKVVGEAAEEHYSRVCPYTGEVYQVVPEFCRMSLRPAIGIPWLRKFHGDVYNGSRDSVVCNGREYKPPRHYDRWMRRCFPFVMEEVEQRRYERRKGTAENALSNKELNAKALLALRKRSIE